MLFDCTLISPVIAQMHTQSHTREWSILNYSSSELFRSCSSFTPLVLEKHYTLQGFVRAHHGCYGMLAVMVWW